MRLLTFTWPHIAFLALAGSFGCSKKQPPQHIAELVSFERNVESQHAQGSWMKAAVGVRYKLGDAIRTGANATAKVKLTRGGGIRLDPETLVRFRKNRGKQLGLDVQAGAVVLEAGDSKVQIDTTIGAATIEQGGRVRLRARGKGKGVRIDVLMGNAILDKDGKQVALTKGQSITVDIGGAVIEDPPAKITAKKNTPTDAGVAPLPAPQGNVTAVVTGSGASIKTKQGWKPLAKGSAKLVSGTRIRVRKRTRVELIRGDERAVVSGPAEVVVGGKADELLRASSGAISVHAKSANTLVAVPGGVIVVKGRPGGSVAEISIKAGRTSVRTRHGEAEVRGRKGQQVLRGGEAARLTRRGTVDIHVRIPTKVAFAIVAGESSTIHDPKAPTPIHVSFNGACPTGGTLQVSRSARFRSNVVRSPGQDGANVELKRGTHYYRVVCNGGKRGKRGYLRVRRNFAKHRLPSRPHHSVVDADGRRYTLVYQNHLPELTFRWLDGPKTSGYTLHIQRNGGKTVRKSASTARYKMRSGALREGKYTWWWTTSVGKSSKKTHLAIDFDNAAATAYLSKVNTKDGVCHVEGATIAGFSVTANGAVLGLDRHQRFVADLRPAGDHTAVAIRIAHPRRGVHYYVVTVK